MFTLSRELILDRVYERGGALLRPDLGLVVDAGAHVGIFSLQAAQWADKVVALEPNAVNFAVLEANVRRNHMSNVMPIEAALWAESSTAIGFGPAIGFGNANHSGGGHVTQTGSEFVKAVSLDDLIAQFGPIDLLKIDIEGAEYEVFGAAKRLGEVREIVGELHIDSPDDDRAENLVNLLSKSGFAVSIVSEKALYGADAVRRLSANRHALARQSVTKMLYVAYLLAPISKPIRAPGETYLLPILTARRHQDDNVVA